MDQTTFYALQALRRRVSELTTGLTKLTGLTVPNIPRRTTVDISGLAGATTAPFVANWNAPCAAGYRVLIQPVIADARLGTIFATVDPATKTPTSVSISVRNSAAQALVAGSLDVVIHPD